MSKLYKDKQLITIGVTTYDRPQLLTQCVASILSQSYSNIEVIIANDYVEVPVTFDLLGLGVDPRVRIINHPENIGAYNNNYYLLREAKGDWFTWLADDDLMHPEFLQISYDVLSKFNVNSVFTNYVAGVDPNDIFPKMISKIDPKIFSGAEFMKEYTSRRIKTVGSYGVYRRNLFEKFNTIKRFGTGLPVYGDTFIPILAASLGEVAYVDTDLIFLRTHPGSRSVSSDCIETYASAQKDFLDEFEQCCSKTMTLYDYQHHLLNMLKWFAIDGWAVIGRKYQSIFGRIAGFSTYAKRTLMPRLPMRLRLVFGLFLSRLFMSDLVMIMASRGYRKVKFWN